MRSISDSVHRGREPLNTRRSEMFVLKDPEYRGHIIDALLKNGHWVAHWALPDRTTPEYREPNPWPKVRYGGGFLRGPYKSKADAIKAAERMVDENHELGSLDAAAATQHRGD
jgi:hypothetical protein